jgi:DNA polymerase-3 subunit gamma/tau
VIEIDAAANKGVDNIREINENVQYPPADGRYKVYIIDEVHMLSIGAFNALLKTLEEPPAYVIFILATTEAHKIPITILSRCQRYDFKRITIDVIAARLQELITKEGIEAEEKAIRYVAKAADGSMRDALSLLDQCIAFYLGEALTYDHVLEVLGAVDTEVFSIMLRLIIVGDTMGALKKLEEVILTGRDLTQFISDFVWYLRNLLLVMTSDGTDISDMLDMSTERFFAIQEEAEMTEEEMVMRYIRVLSELSNQLKYASSKRVLAEVAIVKLAKPQMENDLESVINRIANVEKTLESGSFLSSEMVNAAQISQGANEQKQGQSDAQRKKLEIAVPDEIQSVVNNWGRIQNRVTRPASMYLRNVKLTVTGEGKLLIVTDDKNGYLIINREEIIQEIERLIEEEIQKEVKVEVRLLEENENFYDSFVEVTKNINMEISEEDF